MTIAAITAIANGLNFGAFESSVILFKFPRLSPAASGLELNQSSGVLLTAGSLNFQRFLAHLAMQLHILLGHRGKLAPLHPGCICGYLYKERGITSPLSKCL